MTDINTIAASSDHKWVVCGTDKGASVWDAELHEKAIHVENTNQVSAVDVSPDSTRFAAGTAGSGRDYEASIWSITSGERLVGPLAHDNTVSGIRFSNGERMVTSSFGGSVRIFDSRNGDQLIDINIITRSEWISTPLAWSNDNQQIFTTSDDYKVRSFAVSTGSQIAESPNRLVGCKSISLAPNGKYIATYAGRSISFLDPSTLSLISIVPVVEDSKDIFSIAITREGSHLATGQAEGRVTVRNLGSILPDSHGPFHVSGLFDRDGISGNLAPSRLLL